MTAGAIHRLREADRARIVAVGGVGYDIAVLDQLFSQPLVNASWVERVAMDSLSPPDERFASTPTVSVRPRLNRWTMAAASAERIPAA